MQKRYQIDKQRAVRELQKFASEVNPTIQTVLPLREIVSIAARRRGHESKEVH